MRITDALHTGRQNAITGKELATLFSCDIRLITQQIQRERDKGAPICATMSGANAGYFLAADDMELRAYCGILEHRENELHHTRRQLIKVLKQYADGKTTEQIIEENKEKEG